MDGIALKPLTVSFSEPGFVATLNQENQFGPWFTLSDNDQQQLGSPMGPQNPQALNRYSYVLNNPIKNTDPSGHCTDPLSCTLEGAALGTAIEPGGGTLIGGIGGFILGTIITITVAGGVAYVATHPLDSANTVSESRWEKRATDFGTTKVRKLKDAEVPRAAHRQKGKGNPLGAEDSYYVDKDGKLFSGGDKGELTYEGDLNDYQDGNRRRK